MYASRAFAIGDLVWYVMPAPVRPVWAAGVVVRALERRAVGVLTVLSSRVRYVHPSRLSTDAPPGDAAVYWSVQDVGNCTPRPRRVCSFRVIPRQSMCSLLNGV